MKIIFENRVWNKKNFPVRCKRTNSLQTWQKGSGWWKANFQHEEGKRVRLHRRDRCAEIVCLGVTKKGMVVSTKELKTCIVAVKRRVFHKRYGKVLTATKRLAVHDPYQKAQLGQKVEIRSTRPISKQKRWCLI